MGLNTNIPLAQTVVLKVFTTKTGGVNYVYHTEYVTVVADSYLEGWIADIDANIPTPNPIETVSFEDGELGDKTDNENYIDGLLEDGSFVTKGTDAQRYNLNDGELTHTE